MINRMDAYVPEPLAAAGITYRQYDHWIRRGHLKLRVPRPGSGNKRVLSAAEVQVALRIAEGLREGYTLTTAATRARGDVT